jgi:Tfp pilus assembly protein PilF
MLGRLQSPLLLGTTLLVLIYAASPSRSSSQAGGGSIVGQVRISPGNEIKAPVMITLSSRGMTINSIYTDNEGRFGFNGLPGNLYHVMINEQGYAPVEQEVALDAVIATMQVLTIYLVPKDASKSADQVKGGNTRLADSAQYNQQIPKPARKEFDKGIRADKNGKPDEAIKYYQKAVGLYPQFYEARNNLGSALLSKSKFPDAQEQFEQVVKMNPSDAAAYFNLGNLCLLTQQLDKGQQWVAQGLSKQPDSAFGHFLQGSLYAQTGKPNEAEAALRRSLELDPVMSKAHLALVNLYLRQKRNHEAAAELRDFLKTFPEDPFAPRAKQVLDKLEASNPESKSQP